ncbi:MAG: nucleotidyltransferase domain-containing protein [Chloroflexi bacterium]|nr:MAG: nucleotidyltransferase domain-containing protein [Chloroflexota bacterium]
MAANLARRPEILFAILYGSAAEPGLPFRDIDIGVFVNRQVVSVEQELAYMFSLANELERLIAYPVDVRVINDAPPGFRYNVSRGEPLTVRDERAFYTFLERAWDDYLDFAPLTKRYWQEL